MRKGYRGISLGICLLFLLLTLSACSQSVSSVSEQSALLVDAYAKLTDGQFEEAIGIFSAYKQQFSKPDIAVEIGIGKAYFGVGDYANAEEAFATACGIDPDRADLIHYLGEAQMNTGDYEAAAETFQKLIDLEPANQSAIGKLEQSLRKDRDYFGLYKYYEDRINSADDKTKLDYYSIRLVEAAQLANDDDLVVAAIERLKDEKQYYALSTAIKAYRLLEAGDEEAAKNLLFDVDNIDALMESAGKNSICFVDTGNTEYESKGRGVLISGSGNIAFCPVYIGEISDNKPHGAGVGYEGYINEWENDGRQYTGKTNTYFNTDWKEGVPEGPFTRTYEYSTYQAGKLQYSEKTIFTATYINKLAQGEVWTEYHFQYSTSHTETTFTKHFAKDGLPVPFEVNRNGRTVMAYEAHYENSKNNTPTVNTEPCPPGHRFILN